MLFPGIFLIFSRILSGKYSLSIGLLVGMVDVVGITELSVVICISEDCSFLPVGTFPTIGDEMSGTGGGARNCSEFVGEILALEFTDM